MPTPGELLAQSKSALRNAKRISGPSNSYRKDNPAEYDKVMAYWDGGSRPEGVMQFTLMGQGLVLEEDARRALTPVPPAGGELLWAPPALSNPVTRNLTNASRTVPKGSGQDLQITCGQVLTGNVGEIHTYANVEAIAGAFASTQSANSSGHIVPRQITGTFHLEGWKYDSALAGDFITSRERAKIIQIEACEAHVTDAGTSYHSDFFQTQITDIDELRIDRCTVHSDYQGVVLINESPIPSSPAPSAVRKTIVSRTVFRFGKGGAGMAFFLSKPPKPGNVPLGPIELRDVWMEDGMNCYPHVDFRQWDGNTTTHFGSYLENRQHPNGNTYPFWRFSAQGDVVPAGRPGAGQPASDCNVKGDGGVWIFPRNGNPPSGLYLGSPTDAGMDYVSPGYLP